jgi:RNA polymerase sigma-70 factor (ECF subfamily)
MSLMCFHSSRFEARIDKNGETILYQDQDTKLWNAELISNGEYFLSRAARGTSISKYHLEAGIAYWHTIKEDSKDKWEHILQIYNQLLQIEYSPIAALNRTYALSKAYNREVAIKEAEKLNLSHSHLFHSLLGELYKGIDDNKALTHFQNALKLARSTADQSVISDKIATFGKS